MKKIVLMALLAAAGCNKKGTDCGAAIDKGVTRYMEAVKKVAAASPRLDPAKLADKLKAAMTQRCNDDKWQPEVVACIGDATGSEDLKACEDKLTRDQRTKLDAQVFPIMMGGMGAHGSRMPPGIEGHPATLTGTASGSAAPSGESVGSPPPGPAPAGSAAAPAPPPSGSGGW